MRDERGQIRSGPGAWELTYRYSYVNLNDNMVLGGIYSEHTVGLNWYWNEYIKVYMFWLHGNFADPVQYRPGDLQRSADMFWLRFQLYF